MSDYLEIHLAFNLVKHPQFDSNIKVAIKETFLKTQDHLTSIPDGGAGSTAVVIIIKGKKLYVAWAGDSLATLFFKQGEYDELVDPHKPGKDVGFGLKYVCI